MNFSKIKSSELFLRHFFHTFTCTHYSHLRCLCAWCLPWCLVPSTQLVSPQQPVLTILTAVSPLQAMLVLSLPTLLGLSLVPALTILTAVVLLQYLQAIPTLLVSLLGYLGLCVPTIHTADYPPTHEIQY